LETCPHELDISRPIGLTHEGERYRVVPAMLQWSQLLTIVKSYGEKLLITQLPSKFGL
jgi:hypothetical protein